MNHDLTIWILSLSNLIGALALVFAALALRNLARIITGKDKP